MGGEEPSRFRRRKHRKKKPGATEKGRPPETTSDPPTIWDTSASADRSTRRRLYAVPLNTGRTCGNFQRRTGAAIVPQLPAAKLRKTRPWVVKRRSPAMLHGLRGRSHDKAFERQCAAAMRAHLWPTGEVLPSTFGLPEPHTVPTDAEPSGGDGTASDINLLFIGAGPWCFWFQCRFSPERGFIRWRLRASVSKDRTCSFGSNRYLRRR